MHGSDDPVRHAPGYWHDSRQPLASLLFVLPVLLLYELGVVWLGPQALRNGADVWLGQLLDAAGVASSWALPVLVVAVLLAWHYVTRQPWRVRSALLAGMFLECVLLAAVLLLIARAQAQFFGPGSPPMHSQSSNHPRRAASPVTVSANCLRNSVASVPSCTVESAREGSGATALDVEPLLAMSARVQAQFGEPRPAGPQPRESPPGPVARFLARFIAFCGAGVYEEVLFRLLLLPGCAAAVRWLGASWQASWIVAAVVTSVVFSAAHYVGPHGEPVDLGLARFWFTSTFRAIAGLFFSLLFIYRGFGIAVGTHALYDVFAGLT